MKQSTVFRMAGAVGCLAGVLRVCSAFLSGATTTAIEFLYLVIDLSLLFAVIGIYASQWRSTGRLAFLGFLTSTAGTALIVGPDVLFSGIDLYVVGSLMIVLGLTGLSAAAWRVGRGPLWITVAYFTSLPVGLAGYAMSVEPLTIFSGVIFGAALIGSGAVVGIRTRSQ